MQKNSDAPDARRFEFERDSFAFKNETYWEYHYDGPGGKMTFTKREPKPDYAHRCFVLTRAARQFLYHVRFDPSGTAPDENTARRLIRVVVSRNPRRRAAPKKQIVIPGYANLWEFSRERAQLLKDECGGAWRSYILRSHWRMVFPISREHQAKTAASLRDALERNIPPIIHLVKFPALTINHSMLVFSAKQMDAGWDFQTADPNTTEKPLTLSFNNSTSTFTLQPNHYWSGGELDIIEIYRSWVM